MTVGTFMTADDLLQLPDDGWRYELVEGELRKMSPTGEERGFVSAQILLSLGTHVRERRLGRVYPADVGYRLASAPDTVRAPDVSFVRAERAGRNPKYIEGAPDVAFEVVSPNDRYSEIAEKTRAYLRAGTQAVVIVDPATRTVRVHRPTSTTDINDVLEIPEIFPGWTLPLAELFD